MKHFFITGLPRTRTAWFANFMTWGNVFCFHDALTFAHDAKGLEQLFSEKQRLELDYFGDSDSALPFFTSDLLKLFPESRWVVVRRPLDEAAESYWKFFGPAGYAGRGPRTYEDTKRRFEQLQERIFDLIELVDDILVVNYNELSQKETIRRVWEHCVDVPFNAERWRLLEGLRVNVIPSKVIFK